MQHKVREEGRDNKHTLQPGNKATDTIFLLPMPPQPWQLPKHTPPHRRTIVQEGELRRVPKAPPRP